MFFVKSIQFYFWKFQGHRNGNSHFISIQAAEGGGGEEGEGYGRGLSGVLQLIQLSHGSLPMKYCLDVLRSCSVRFIFYTLHTFCSKKDC